MTAASAALAASTTGLVAWLVKAVAIGIAGGLDRSPLEGPLFLLGLLAVTVASACLGVALAARRTTVVKVLAGLAGAVAAPIVMIAVQTVVVAVLPASVGWVEHEAGLWLAAGAFVVAALVVHRARVSPGRR